MIDKIQINYNNNFINFNKQLLFMSLSSLPDIFRRSSTLSVRVQKQGGPFSLNLNNYLTERNQTSRAGYAPGENNNENFHSTKGRSISMQSVRVKPSILRD